MENLWGDLKLGEIDPTPVEILKTQAAKIGELTSNVVQGQVVPIKAWVATDPQISVAFPRGTFVYEMNLIVPPLDNYTYEFLRIKHDISLYPVIVTPLFESENEIVCASEAAFIHLLRQLLSSDSALDIVRTLIAQARAVA